MAHLRIRVEQRNETGVDRLRVVSHIMTECEKFFSLLAEDVGIQSATGTWRAVDFQRNPLNFTAEYSESLTREQVEAFHHALAGQKDLRPATVAQFAKVANILDEKSQLRFGWYEHEDSPAPTAWRTITASDARRTGVEVANGGNGGEAATGAPHADEAESIIRAFARLEQGIQQNSAEVKEIGGMIAASDEGFLKLLAALEGFVDKTSEQIDQISQELRTRPPAEGKVHTWLLIASGAAIGCLATLLITSPWVQRPTSAGQATAAKEKAAKEKKAEAPAPQPGQGPAALQPPAGGAPQAPVQTTPAEGSGPQQAAAKSSMHVELIAKEPTWVSFKDSEGKPLMTGLLTPGEPRAFDLEHAGLLRSGNAGGLEVRLNGKSIGPIGPKGGVRQIEFFDGKFRISAASSNDGN
jgi:hypothetical protein